jgi:hypothetical protein
MVFLAIIKSQIHQANDNLCTCMVYNMMQSIAIHMHIIVVEVNVEPARVALGSASKLTE